MTAPDKPDTNQRALSLNLDSKIFGSCAETGAFHCALTVFLELERVTRDRLSMSDAACALARS